MSFEMRRLAVDFAAAGHVTTVNTATLHRRTHHVGLPAVGAVARDP